MIANMESTGFLFNDNSSTLIQISNCDFRNIGKAAVSIDSPSPRTVLSNSTFKDCRNDADSGAVCSFANSSSTKVSNCDFLNASPTTAWGIIWSGTHNHGAVTGCGFQNFTGGDIGYSGATFNDGYRQSNNVTDGTEVAEILGPFTSAYNGNGPLRLGDYYLWVDSTGDLRIKNGAPSSDTDGTIVGTQS